MGIFKKLITAGVGLCVHTTISKLIKDNTDKPEGILERIAIFVGSYAIGSAVADKVSEYVIDDLEETYKEIQSMTKEIETTASLQVNVSVGRDDEDADYEVN